MYIQCWRQSGKPLFLWHTRQGWRVEHEPIHRGIGVQAPLRQITLHVSYFGSCSLGLLFFFLFRLLLGTRNALLSAVEGAVEKAVIPRIADRVEDSRHHRANEQRVLYFLLSFCPSTTSTSAPASAISRFFIVRKKHVELF